MTASQREPEGREPREDTLKVVSWLVLVLAPFVASVGLVLEGNVIAGALGFVLVVMTFFVWLILA